MLDTATPARSDTHPGLPAGARIVVAMSGGVDSSTVAALLKDQGYDVVGITLQLYDHGAARRQGGTCCAGADIADARAVAETLGIPHYVLDYENRFRSAVIDDFADSYARGETPIPCVRCNSRIKFEDLLSMSRELGAAALATGHYVRRVEGQAGPELHRAADDARDQSYFLFATTREQLGYLRFPLGVLKKSETRELAARYGLRLSAKPDSQDICFVPDGRYAEVIERLRPGAAEPGDIVDLDGRVLGRHDGIIHYTVGQRRGLKLGGGDPVFVVRLDAGKREVIVGPRSALQVREIVVGDINWLGNLPLGVAAQRDIPVLAKVRSMRPPVPGRLVAGASAARARCVLDDGEEGVAPGQACVFYDKSVASRVLGGGFIRGSA